MKEQIVSQSAGQAFITNLKQKKEDTPSSPQIYLNYRKERKILNQ